jgi:hypothetical protein
MSDSRSGSDGLTVRGHAPRAALLAVLLAVAAGAPARAQSTADLTRISVEDLMRL